MPTYETKIEYEQNYITIHAKCPKCHKQATFTPIENIPDMLYGKFDYSDDRHFATGLRYCPSCKNIILFEARYQKRDKSIKELYITPRIMLKTEIKNLPSKIEQLLNEALGCYSNNYYTAAGMLIRKTLEAICDNKQAKGDNLHQRINALKKQVTIAEPLYEAAMQLKLLGNDAAHIDLKDFDNIGQEELDLAFTLLERILKSIYEDGIYLEALLSKKKS